MPKAIAIANNDISIVAWSYEKKLADCLGFAIYRIAAGKRTLLPAWVGFAGDANAEWKAHTTEEWPVQKFTWRDLTCPFGTTCQYEVVPMIGTPGNLEPSTNQKVQTNSVTLTPKLGDVSAFFNRGILSTQSLAHQVPAGPSGAPNYKKLIDRIDQPGDPLRNRLAGQMRVALLDLLERVEKDGGSIFGALYEFNDPELEQRIIQNAKAVHLILANTGPDDETNVATRQALHETSGLDVNDRMLGSGHIGHNKFLIYCDGAGTPRTVLTGSTNWTYTALCAQSNNALIIESKDLAKIYKDYWDRLLADDAAQGTAFRATNNTPHSVKLDGGKTDLSLWFSPNTRQKNKPKDPTTPKDLEAVYGIMAEAKKSILFLAFQPGSPSIFDEAGKLLYASSGLFVRGAVTDPGAVDDFNVALYHRSGAAPDAIVVAATEVKDQFAYWQKELLKSSPQAHAIIHDKIVVVDPFSDDCAVITGSHNLGYRASYNNDENLVIVRKNKLLAQAYAAHVLDVYEHYRWRYTLQIRGDQAWTGLRRNDAWQDKYFTDAPEIQKEFAFWR